MGRKIYSARQEVKILCARLRAQFLRAEIKAPVFFIIGCGRSGKSTLGTALALHPQVAFLDDESWPQWAACFPKTDLWSGRVRQRGGSLYLDAADAEPERARRLRALFQYAKGGRTHFLQSLDANSFRIDFLRAVFPDAKFIHVVRNGLEVAAEIAQRIERRDWHGKDDHKWRQLSDYGARAPHTAALPELCAKPFQRGLLEWRLVMEAVQAAQLPQESLLEIRYKELLAQPREQLLRSAAFIGLAEDTDWEARAVSSMHRTAPVDSRQPSETDLRIGGPFLRGTA